jgi:hypothetical protein
MKKFLRNLLLFPTLFPSILSGYGKIMMAVPIILNFIKDNAKVELMLIGLGIGGYFSNKANAGGLYIECRSKVSTPAIIIKHINGATETPYDGNYDGLFPPSPVNPTIDFYSKTDYLPPQDRLTKDSRPPGSMSTITSEISGRGLTSPENAELNSLIFYPSGENNFSWKNIIGELSQRIDDGNGGYKYALIGNYDIKYMVNSATTIPISINNGITQGDKFFPSHKLDYSFSNHADLNRDRKVNGLDFAIWAGSFGRNNETDPNTFGSYVGSEPNNFNAYADIDRNGRVDYNDLSIFSGEWLWDANDPNTWSRVR